MKPARRLLVALVAALVPAATTIAVAAAEPGGDPLDAVNTFIGTQDEGNTFPGASAPFGMTQAQDPTVVFSSFGRYPAVPGTGRFVLNAPQFPKAVVHVDSGRDVVLTAGGADAAQLQYVRGLRVNGVASDRAYVSLEQLTRGATLDFGLTGDVSQATWATGPGGAPPSPYAS